MVGLSLVERHCLLLLSVMLVSLTTADVKVDVIVEPVFLPSQLNNSMEFTVACTAREEIYRRYRYDTSRILSRLRILIETSVYNTWQPMAQLSNMEPSRVFVDPSFPNVKAVGSISPSMLSKSSGLSVTWTGPTVDAIRRFRCDAITFDSRYRELGHYHYDDTRTKTENLNSYSLTQLSSGDKITFMEKLNNISTKMDKEKVAASHKKATSDERVQVDHILMRLKQRIEEAKRTQAEKLERMGQILNDLITHYLENNTRQLDTVRNTLDSAVEGSFLMLWPNGTYALPMPSSGCPSTSGQYWKEGSLRHHTESIQRNEDEVSPGHHLQQPVLNRIEDKFFVYQRFCVKTEGNTFGPAWPRGSYCINAVSSCPDGFGTGYLTWDEEDFRPSAIHSGNLPSGEFEDTKTMLKYCCRQDGRPEESVDMPRFQPFYLYRYGGKCQQVVGMNVTEEYIHFDTENSNNGDKALYNHPDVELNDLVLHLCYYVQA
ncbi:hypothetical protein EGW08_009813 [Elysia chlorotica]|uniref:Apextrin C-terminal domain-containing protein n=1 Tax=Elysia chlorotica TaxID=188477 RepID=A0A433TLK0_ELYCH|nr:hypothetical protein EGW08_009813 [Elysia chlorotica]